jgi:superfamily II DNA/RNA helicase
MQTIAPAMERRDVIGTAQTGTGKTAAFMVPIVEPPAHQFSAGKQTWRLHSLADP